LDSFFQGKRIFDQEGERILELATENIYQYVNLSSCVAIKKGDLLSPSKWIDYEHVDRTASLIPLEDFNLDDYEYVFFLFVSGARELRKLLGLPLLGDDVLDYQSIFKIDAIPVELSSELKELIKGEDYINTANFNNFVTDVFVAGKDTLILDRDGVYDVSEELTSKFLNMELQLSKSCFRDGKKLQLLKLNDPLSRYTNDEKWYVYYDSEITNARVLEEIRDIEDILKYTDFK